MATSASPLEVSKTSSEDAWRLAYEVQAAALQCDDSKAVSDRGWSLRLRSNPVFQVLQASIEPRISLAIRNGTGPSEERQSTLELIQSCLVVLEAEASDLIKGLNCSFESLDAIRRAMHEFVRRALPVSERLESRDRALRRSMYNFAYGLSHEINNPLANIAARARQMFNESTDARHRKSLATMADAAMRAHEMLAEMMLAVKGPTSRLQSGDLRACLLSAAKEWSSLAKEQHLTWRESICDDFLRCRFDRIALFEALSVAIRNAVEACRPGDTVEFVAERFESERGQLEIRLAILDNGSGLSEESLQHAWDLYYCGREAGRGLGIGLCKLRRVIEDHSGRVWLDSKARAGCTVEIRLPWDYRQKP